jgi:hypothetical protein
MSAIVWLGILLCISQSAMFSGLNLAFFSISKLRLEVERRKGSKGADKVLELRNDAHFLLTTILWGNVGINVLLTLLSNQVLVGIGAFLFSTIFITVFGEIVPQAYFSRNALRLASWLSPVLKVYQILLYPVAKPSAIVLDRWLGQEGIQFYLEKDLKEMLSLHMADDETEINWVEALGAMNFLRLDDLAVSQEGEVLVPDSIIALPSNDGKILFPEFSCVPDDPFLLSIQKSGEKWIIFTDLDDRPQLAMDADNFLRKAFFAKLPINPMQFCHRPIVIEDLETKLEHAIVRLYTTPQRVDDDVIDKDIILIWSETKKVITGADLLGRLFRGIVEERKQGPVPHPQRNVTAGK